MILAMEPDLGPFLALTSEGNPWNPWNPWKG